eukprot:maker-scaffold353_size198981-snap-gene-0.36 protein:Tk05251 transcript:maker-scaffold353_size198981-snap-gene-0.36-mRNA-1 annotation:"glutaminase liver mitochondrial"
MWQVGRRLAAEWLQPRVVRALADILANESVTRSIFQMYKNKESDTINISHLFREVEKTGIWRTDARLGEFYRAVREYHERAGPEGTITENINVDFDVFKKLSEENIVFLAQIFRNDLNASYIPQLARYDPDIWACSVCTVDGQRLSLGNVRQKFTIQSCSKPFTYGICLNELGPEVVHKYVSHEPSGRNFNEICLDSKLKPHNPMLNSGALMISSLSLFQLHPEMRLAEKFDYMQNYLKRIAGGETIGFNNAVYLSERETADRNFAMAYFMREHKCFPPNFNLQECMDLYFQFCSLEVSTESLAVMGATLANGGICPTTGEKVLKSSCVRDVLSLMYSCGMYNHSGQFAFNVGLPAKSGVSGALVLVVPNVMAIALWSPPLDRVGNSVRGVQFSNELVDTFNFHRFDNLRHSEKKIDPCKHQYLRRSSSCITLLFAAKSGDITALKRHYLQGVDLNQSDYDGRTALHVAAAEGQFECVKFLLEITGIKAMPQDRWGFTPLDDAVRFEHDQVGTFIQEHIDLTQQN